MSEPAIAASADSLTHPSLGQQLLTKAPQITLFSWIIKTFAATVGETAADFLNTQLNFWPHQYNLYYGCALVCK